MSLGWNMKPSIQRDQVYARLCLPNISIVEYSSGVNKIKQNHYSSKVKYVVKEAVLEILGDNSHECSWCRDESVLLQGE